ncbi:hypothetical protein EZE46_29435 [Bacillus sp. BH2]|nr:hypothetical protein DY470_13285 [Bacillus anthracis]TEA45124.1 hypothetical protein EZE46_29435 [Bacillus sp. BH2]
MVINLNAKAILVVVRQKGPAINSRPFPKMAKSNSYLTLPLYNTPYLTVCVEKCRNMKCFVSIIRTQRSVSDN